MLQATRCWTVLSDIRSDFLDGPVQSQELVLMIHMSPLQLAILYDSMILQSYGLQKYRVAFTNYCSAGFTPDSPIFASSIKKC